MKLLFLKGLPGSGKSTWAKEFVEKNPDWIRVNRDDLRRMRGRYWYPKQEKLITKFENQIILVALEAGHNVIVDATNLNDDRNKLRIKTLSEKFNEDWDWNWNEEIHVEFKNFNLSVEDCIKNDLKRPNSVGADVIWKMYNKYNKSKPVIYNEDKYLPHCIIFDIDGTLSSGGNRGPFDWNKVKNDEINENIVSLYKTLAFHAHHNHMIVFSGRDEICRDDTIEWLRKNDIHYEHLYMRPKGNCEKDAIIKKRLFEEYIREKYYCEFVVDDRQQVVDMWRRELGLTCLQCDYGKF